MLPIPILLYVLESYENQFLASPEYTSRFSYWIGVHNMTRRGQKLDIMEKVNYWGSDMWYWQHWVRKGLLYFTIGYIFIALKVIIIIFISIENVTYFWIRICYKSCL
jgi:hypothetical protein